MAKVFGGGRWRHRFVPMMMGMIAMRVRVRTARRLTAAGSRGTGGNRLRLAPATRTSVASLGRGLSQEILPAMLAAKIVRLAVAFSVQRGRFIHGHSANRVGFHSVSRSLLAERSSAALNLANADPGILLRCFSTGSQPTGG